MNGRFTRASGLVVSAAMLLATQIPGLAHAQSGAQPLVIGVDHPDMDNQRPDMARVFEYTDFFARDATIHSGDMLDFRFAPSAFHIVALAASEDSARAVDPVAMTDAADNHPAKGTGLPKLELGPSTGPNLGGSNKGGGTIGGLNDIPSCG